jgi:hypothetical protein
MGQRQYAVAAIVPLRRCPSRLLKRRSPPIGDRDSLAPTRFGDGDNRTGELFSYIDLEARVRRNHPLRAIRTIVNEALSALEREFPGLYPPIGRPSIPPEKLLRAMLLQAFYSHRGGIRLDQDGRRAREDQLPWP